MSITAMAAGVKYFKNGRNGIRKTGSCTSDKGFTATYVFIPIQNYLLLISGEVNVNRA